MQRAQTAERMEESLIEQHVAFAHSMTNEILCRCTTDALATYLQLYPERVLVNMEELEGLITTMSVEVGQKWDAQVTLWNDVITQTLRACGDAGTLLTRSLSSDFPLTIPNRGKSVEAVASSQATTSGEHHVSLNE